MGGYSASFVRLPTSSGWPHHRRCTYAWAASSENRFRLAASNSCQRRARSLPLVRRWAQGHGIPQSRGGALQERIEEIVTDRTDAYERLKKIMMTTQAQLWRSQAVQKNYARNQTGLRRHLEHWLPEIKQLPKANCEAVHAAASFETWHRLRIHQKLNISDARDSVTAMLTKLMD